MKKLFGILGVLWPLCSFGQTDSIVRVGACATNHYPWNLVVQDSLVYLADRGSFVVIDVSNPANPKIRGTTENFVLPEANVVGRKIGKIGDGLLFLTGFMI